MSKILISAPYFSEEGEDNPGGSAAGGEVCSQTTLNNFWPKILDEVKRQVVKTSASFLLSKSHFKLPF
jgi:hypothetical protein